MNWPTDTPLWIERVFKEVEEEVSELVAKSSTTDMAMKSAGAYWLWNKIKSEVLFEISRQDQAEKKRIEDLHARVRSDA